LGTSLGQWNYFWVFRPKRIQSTTLGPRLMFWVVSPHLVAASAPWRNRVLGCRFGTSSGQRNFFRDFLTKCFQSTTLGPKLMFWVVSHHLVATSAALPNQVLGCRFGTSLGWSNYCRVFRPKCNQSTTLGPNLTFWVVSHHLVAASAPLRNRILGCRFGTSLGWPNYCRVFRPKCNQSTTLGPNLTFWVVSHHLVAASAPLWNRILGCRFGTSSGQWNLFRDFLPKCIQSTTFGPKLIFWAVSHHLVVASTPLQNRVLGCRMGSSLGQWNYCWVLQLKHYFRSKTHV